MTDRPDYRALAEAYANAHGEMTLASVDVVIALCADKVIFHDPFNDTIGKAELRHLFVDMFKSTKDPRTQVLALLGDGREWIVKWRFTAGLPVIGAINVPGVTELVLDEAGLIDSHVDYWDSGLEIYGRLPVVGGVVRSVRKRLSAKSRP